MIGDQKIRTMEGSGKRNMKDKEPIMGMIITETMTNGITKGQETKTTTEGTRTLTQKEKKINQVVTTTTTLRQMKTIENMTTTNPGKQVGNMAT